MNLYLDVDNMKLVRGINDPQAPEALQLACRDTVPIKVTVLQVNTGNTSADLYVPVDLAAGRSLVFGAKPATALNGPYFVTQPVWTHGATGIYTADLELNEDLLIASVGVDTTVVLLAEFTQVDGVGNNYSSIQFLLTVIPDVTRGGEPVAVRISPAGEVWALVVADGGMFSGRRIA
jgi:hypothetical protein